MKRKSSELVWNKLVQTFVVCLFQFVVILLIIKLWLLLVYSSLENFSRIICSIGIFFLVQQDIFFPPNKEKVNFYKKSSLPMVGCSVRVGKIAIFSHFYNWQKIGSFQRRIDTYFFSCHNSQPLHNVMQKEVQNLNFFQCVNFQKLDSLKNNSKNCLLTLDNSCEEFLQLKNVY